MHWKTEKNTPFPMPVEVRVGERIETLAMKDGSGSISVPAGATWTIDPHSKVLRRLEHIEALPGIREKQAQEAKLNDSCAGFPAGAAIQAATGRASGPPLPRCFGVHATIRPNGVGARAMAIL